ncbi:amidase [Aquipuribacter sp. SD81]|uniref:amidase n=1 Tax=Aquipuribacter sp. SD81 TaxID=3127703 RepID=UPI0030176DE4
MSSATLLVASPVAAVTDVSPGPVTWQVHDAAPPGLDTGSLRTVSGTSVQGFGNLFADVDTDPAPLFDEQMVRGFGMTFDGDDTFVPTRSVPLGEVLITRELHVDDDGTWVRFVDSFTNPTSASVEVDTSFGGALGYGSGSQLGTVATTSSGDAVIDTTDTWTVVSTPSAQVRPVALVVGEPGTPGALTGTGNQERNPFRTPLATSGHEANFYGYLATVDLEPGETRSLVRFVAVGEPGDVASAAASAAALAADPDLSELDPALACTVANFTPATLGLDAARCAEAGEPSLPEAPELPTATSRSAYDVSTATIAQMRADLRAGRVTSQEITRAYLDRIAVYDSGPYAFHAFITVAEDAMKQAKAADKARKKGSTAELLGIPIAVKDIYDTADMPTTGGTRALEGWQPETDAHQVALLREAGAVIIGKTNTSEFANSGGYSESGYEQTWNALYPSKTSFGSSGGSAVAVATGMAAAGMGSQTGVSLYAPATGNSLTTFRGTDGMASVHGVMPLTWGQDYAGPIARTVTDLAYLLNATTGTDPKDPLTAQADRYRPTDWTDALDPSALAGARIGYLPTSFVSSYADDGTGEAVRARFADLEAAGATMVEMTPPPSGGASPGGSRNEEGWARYIGLHPDFPYPDGDALLASPLVLPYNQRTLRDTPRMTEEQVDAWLAYRNQYKARIAAWMDAADVDAVVYPGFLSDVYNNDSANNQLTADRGTGVLTSAVGLPTVVVPVGTNPHGYSMSMQLMGRAWDDAAVLGMGYALEQQADGQLLTSFAPPLAYDPTRPPHSFRQGRPEHSFETGRPAHAPGSGPATGRLPESQYSD